MGRYYGGDIEGKFWFALQSSEAPMRFGGMMELSFSFYDDDIESVKAELKKIEDSTPIDKIKKFFEQNIGWNDEKIAEAGFTKEELSDYADHELGTQILNCLEEQGQCNFLGQI
tara:strand:+ start:200 stop:541 length:342 start_codon:yes stop_codon:yes gene_type:complete